MKNCEVIYDGNHIVAFNKILFKTFSRHLFDPTYLLSKGLLIQSEEKHQGRGSVKIFRFSDMDMVLRHYHRGGLPAKFIKDHYVWLGLQKTRAIREANVLSDLRAKNLSVPKPVAVHIHKKGIRYCADIITAYIPETKTLGEILLVKSLDAQIWNKIGNTIRKFHDHNCNHADLNANNIMLNQKNEIYLIDFDRSRIEAAKGRWQGENLKRLRRSLDKCVRNNPNFQFSNENFASLMQGYGTI